MGWYIVGWEERGINRKCINYTFIVNLEVIFKSFPCKTVSVVLVYLYFATFYHEPRCCCCNYIRESLLYFYAFPSQFLNLQY